MIKKEFFINMENEIFRGNLLDIGLDNNGIVYNIYKEFNHNINLEYIIGEDQEKNILEGYYDLCILLFSFSTICSKMKKRAVIDHIHKYLNSDGMLYIWDIDKKIGRIFSGDIKILVPGKKLKKIRVRNFNLIEDNSKESTLDIINEHFELKEYTFNGDIYHIKAKNKCEGEEEKLKEVSISRDT
ncbi:class I SAM-dependent methyltransferase [Clostridium sp. LBM24168]